MNTGETVGQCALSSKPQRNIFASTSNTYYYIDSTFKPTQNLISFYAMFTVCNDLKPIPNTNYLFCCGKDASFVIDVSNPQNLVFVSALQWGGFLPDACFL
jgi:hypothetical protein